MLGVNLNPYLRWSQDIDGNSHRTGNFLEGRNAMTVGMDAIYLNNLEVGVQYTEFTGPNAQAQCVTGITSASTLSTPSNP